MEPMDEKEANAQIEQALDMLSQEPHQEILKFFKFSHLPDKLQDVSSTFGSLALGIVIEIPPSAERSVALRKLLESKDAAVRAAL